MATEKKLKGFAWMKKHKPKEFYEISSKSGKITQQRHPNQSKENMIKTHQKYPELGKRFGQLAKEHPEWGRLGGITTHKKHPNLARRMGIISNLKHPHMARERGLKSTEVQTQKGFVSKPEKIMRRLLPTDFIHGKRLGNVGVPDFHSPERKIVVEVDGVYWHSKPEIIKRDKSKTAYWQKMGYQIFRITDLDVNEYMKPLLI